MGTCCTRTQPEHVQINTDIVLDNNVNVHIQEVHHSEECHCETVDKCLSLQKLIKTLKFYTNQNHDALNDETLIKFIASNKIHLINDYHHILDRYLNEDNTRKQLQNAQYFQLIYQQIMTENNDLLCDISKCQIYSRSNRQREKQQIECDKNLIFYIDILDSIHCYFLHSVDIGYRIIDELKHETKVNNIDNIYSDKQLSKLKTYLYSKRKQLEHIRGRDRLQNNKFVTEISSSSENKINDDNALNAKTQQNQTETNDSHYSFGHRYEYWPDKYRMRGYHNTQNEESKYRDLKWEVTHNKVYCIDMDKFETAYKKAKDLMNASNYIRKIKSNIELLHYKKYGIPESEPINISNILSVSLYTDYDTLQHHFTKTFRKCNGDKQEMVERHKEYKNWSKILCETVNCFGTKMSETNINVFYHGVSQIYFDEFIATFNSPTSTTTKLQIAAIFAKNDGLILELSKYSLNLKYFDCSFISYFANEDERLFIQPPSKWYHLQFTSIRNVSTEENYKDFIDAIMKLEQLIDFDKFLSSTLSTKCVSIINTLLSSSPSSSRNNNNKYPNYVLKTFQKWTNQRVKIRIRMDQLIKYGSILYLRHETVNNLLRFDNINFIFKQIETIHCEGVGIMSTTYLDELLKILQRIIKFKYSAIRYIYLKGIKNINSISGFCKYSNRFRESNWMLSKNENKNLEIMRYQ